MRIQYEKSRLKHLPWPLGLICGRGLIKLNISSNSGRSAIVGEYVLPLQHGSETCEDLAGTVEFIL